ncbi:DNA/RNA non-specific endonuclease [Neorhizobium galegae bv. orientalis]|nr:DNA/RNA non-specific endonuclease [Neorhizobium galegae bv. orientalis]
MPDRLSSFTDFKEASDELWQRRNSVLVASGLDDETKASFKHDVASFIKVGESTGAFLGREDERQSAQDLLEMWSVELVTLGELEDNNFAVPRLAPFASEENEREAESPEKVAMSRDLIRLSATARQWLGSNRAKGYLLNGDALEQARALVEKDRDIAELVRASDEEVHLKSRARQKTYVSIIGAMTVLSILLIVATVVAVTQMFRANYERDQVRDAGDYATKVASERINALERSRDLAASSANSRFAELTALQSRYDTIVQELNNAARSGSLDRETAPQALKDLLAPEERKFVFPTAESTLLNGYSPNFLGVGLELPKLSVDLVRTAYKEGAAIPYTNYSLILDQARRLPIVSISNVDRSRLGVFPRLGLPFTFDPRLPRDVQPDPEWFRPATLDIGHLVTRREIAWSAVDLPGPSSPAALFEGIVSVYSNTAPQVDNLNRTAWSLLENYAIDAFNPGAARVTILTGPTFHGTPPPDLETAPTHFWKIMVSTRADRTAPELVVEAYLLPQIDPDGFPRDLAQILERYRVRVTDIEALTGLDFGQDVRAANARSSFAQQQVITNDDRLRALAQALARDGASHAATAKDELVSVLSQANAPSSSIWTIVSTLVALAGDGGVQTAPLTNEARSAIVTAFAAVPPASWSLPEWQDVRAGVRRIVADWSEPTGSAAPSLDQVGRDAVGRLKQALGFQLAAGETVYFQFAGFTRDAAVAISADLKKLGWTIPGEERRLRQAAGQNEVRYAPGDEGARAKAELLAADIRALDHTQVIAVPNGLIKPGTLEIWISI